MIDGNTVMTFASLLTAAGVIIGGIMAVFKWFEKQNKQSADIEELHLIHSGDMEKMQGELCLMTFGLLAALDGLEQLGCKGNVSDAHTKLEKHLNKKAHNMEE